MANEANKSKEIDQETLQKLSETDGIPKFSQVCRACLRKTNESDLQLNTTMVVLNQPQEIKSLLEESTGVRIIDSDLLPNLICDRCLKTLRSWYKFRSHTQRSYEILDKYLKKLSSSLDDKTFSSTDLAIHFDGDKLEVVPKLDVRQIDDFEVTVVNDRPEVVDVVFHCDSCTMTFADQVDLDKHKEEHITRKSKTFKCADCGKGFVSRLLLNNHKELYHIHSSTHKFKCDLCGKNFRSPAVYRRHTNKPCVSRALIEQCKFRPVDVSLEDVLALGEKAIRETKVSCVFCKKKFKNYNALVQHYPVHKDNLKCSICQKVCRSVRFLDVHVRRHLKKSIVPCPFCSRSYYSVYTMLKHVRGHSKKEWVYRCNVCEKEFLSLREFEEHMLKHFEDEEDEKKKAPEIEDIKIENKIEIGSDFESNNLDEDDSSNEIDPSSQEPFQLVKKEEENPEQDMAVEIKMDSPIDIVDSIEEPKFIKSESQVHSGSEMDTDHEDYHGQSEETNQFYTNETKVKAEDIVISEGGEEINDEKPELDNSSSSEEEQDEEKEEDEKNEKDDDTYMEKLLETCKVTCHVPGCQTKRSTFTNIWFHFSTDHLIDEKPFECIMCSEKFNDRRSIRLHIKKYYSFNCPVCQKSQNSCSALKSHVINNHSNRIYKCLVCGKTFAGARSLKLHDFVHSNTRQFNCRVCDKDFLTPTALRSHIQTHTVLKELSCSICNRQFARKYHLDRHTNRKACGKRRPYKKISL